MGQMSSAIHGRGRRTATETISEAVCEKAEIGLEDLEPLASVMDTEALDAMAGNDALSVEIEFEYHGFRVTVRSGAEVDLEGL